MEFRLGGLYLQEMRDLRGGGARVSRLMSKLGTRNPGTVPRVLRLVPKLETRNPNTGPRVSKAQGQEF